MQQSTTILEQIAHLTLFRSAYNHFLASDNSRDNVENATYIKGNLKTTNISINKLHEELDNINSSIKLVNNNLTKVINYVSTPNEDRAIMLFNSDKRYRYRE